MDTRTRENRGRAALARVLPRVAAPALSLTLLLSGCDWVAPQDAEAHEPPMMAPADGSPIDETIWMALATEPRLHLLRARDALRDGKPEEASAELRSAGGFLRLEATHALGNHVHERLVGAGIELSEVGRQLMEGTVSGRELDEVSARALLAVAEHHRELAGAAFHEGKAALGGVHLAEASREMEQAYHQAGLTLAPESRKALDRAREAGDRLQNDGSPASLTEADGALVELREDAGRLENALGARRK